MKRLVILVMAALFAACSSTDYDEPGPAVRERRPPMRAEGRDAVRGAADIGLGAMPLDNWWHDPQIAEPLNLTGEQYAALDKAQIDHGDGIAKLQRDSMVALRDFRQALTAEKPSQDEIINAGQRVRALRDQILDRQVKLIAAERVILTADQWRKFQQQMQEDREDWRSNRNYPRQPGRGGWGGARPRGGRGY